jgi:CheY-like chemotaxis protein
VRYHIPQRGRPDESEDRTENTDSQASEDLEAAGPLPKNPEGLKILFVEDNLINQKLLKRKLETKGFNVVTANNGKEAVDAYRTASAGNASSPAYDCILMDQEMPVMDGNAATRAIRDFEKEQSLPRVHIIGVTANVRKEQQMAMKDAGMDSVLSKPFKIDGLVNQIGRPATAEKKN